MNKRLNILIGILFAVMVLSAGGVFYVIDETRQVVLTQFGKLIGEPKKEAGLYFKLPFIQKVNSFEKRILEWDGDADQIPTYDKQLIWVDVTARWRIADPLQFMKSVRTESNAQSRLDDIIDAKTREVISSYNIVESIRNSNRLLEEGKEVAIDVVSEEFGKTALAKIKNGREELSQQILKRSDELVMRLGIKLVDVKIKRINFIEQVQRKVYERMKAERKRAAEKFISEGEGKKAEIAGQTIKDLKNIQSEAYRKAQEIKGTADAKAVKIYAEAYNKDPEFYSFTKTLETYRRAINKDTTLMMSTDNDFYSYLDTIKAAGRMP